MRRLSGAVGVTAAIATVAFSVGGSAPAGAAAGCPGSLIESRSLNVGGKKVGELAVYYDRGTGKNCAKMSHAGSTWGKKLRTSVWLGICSQRKPGKVCWIQSEDRDDARYRYYAGPVTPKQSARGRCIYAEGVIWIGGTRHAVQTWPWASHCGR